MEKNFGVLKKQVQKKTPKIVVGWGKPDWDEKRFFFPLIWKVTKLPRKTPGTRVFGTLHSPPPPKK